MPTLPLEKKICDAALKCAASKAWGDVTLADIAKAAKLSLSQVTKLFPDTASLLPALVLQTDNELSCQVGKPAKRGTAHDRLFDVLMTRFDILQTHRCSFLSLATGIKHDPSLARHLLPAHIASMKTILALAGITMEATQEWMATAGLLALYAFVFCTWERDASPDLSKTMAMLDKQLRRASKLAEILLRTH